MFFTNDTNVVNVFVGIRVLNLCYSWFMMHFCFYF